VDQLHTLLWLLIMALQSRLDDQIGSGREAGVAGARGGAVTGETLEWPTGG
jgi:hypothetical protein